MTRKVVNQRKIKCPVCGQYLEHVRAFNEKIMGIKHNPYIGWVCTNPECKSWYCEYCEEWHRYGTSCAVAMVRNSRERETHYCTEDPHWRHQEARVQGKKRKWKSE